MEAQRRDDPPSCFPSAHRRGRVTQLALADVCGHSAEVVETSESIRRLMRDNIYYINQNRLADPADFVSDVHMISLWILNEQQY